MANQQSNGTSAQELERENTRLKRELAKAKENRTRDLDAICLLLAGGKPISLEDVQEQIAAGSPYLEQLIEIEKVMKDEEQVLIDTMANPIPFKVILDDLECLLRGEGHVE